MIERGASQTVQQVLAARIDRLPADQKAALQLAAVLGREFSLDLAEEVWDGNVPLEARLQELKRLEFLRERHGLAERTFMFSHVLTREVAYDGMLEARRRELHGRAGACVEHSQANQSFERCELLAYHYSRSADPARAVPYLAVAADRAKDRYANEEAIRLHKEALSIFQSQPAGRDRDSQELAILEAVAAPLNARHGYGHIPARLRHYARRTCVLGSGLMRRRQWHSELATRCGHLQPTRPPASQGRAAADHLA